MTMYDYVIVGGGSAGCVLAARLSEMPETRVLLIEAGPKDSNPYIHMPVGFFKMTSGPLIWGYETAPLRHANNRRAVYPQARVLGGGSSINAEIYTRGCPEDYDNWATQHGCDGWSWRDLQPYFIRSEGNARLGGAEHGIDGPLAVSDLQSPNRVSLAYVQGCMDIGMPHNPDFNSGRQEGAGLYQTTTRDGRRCSAAVGYLRPVMGRKNLQVRTDLLVNRIIIENGRAAGVEVSENGGLARIDAASEVIVTAGAVGSPKLLMLSGIGPADHLRDVGVAVVHDLPGVGQNFHDHFSTDVTWILNGPHSYDKYKKRHWQAWAGLAICLVPQRAGGVEHRRSRRLLVERPQREDARPAVPLPRRGRRGGGRRHRPRRQWRDLQLLSRAAKIARRDQAPLVEPCRSAIDRSQFLRGAL